MDLVKEVSVDILFFGRCAVQPSFYRNATMAVTTHVHQEDFYATGPPSTLRSFQNKLDEHLALKWSDPLWPGDRYSYSKNTRIRTSEGVYLCGNPKYGADSDGIGP